MSLLIFLGVAALLALIGILVKYFQCYWLISGYNTASKEKKQNMDIVGLSRFTGNYTFLIAGIILLGGLLNYIGFYWGTIVSMIAIFALVPFILLKAQRFDKNTQTPAGKTKPAVIALFIFISALFLIIIGVVIYGGMETGIQAGPEGIKITGIYGMTIHNDEIRSIELKETIPHIQWKSNGFDFGPILKGYFRVKGVGKAKLFIDARKPPFIYIRTDRGLIIINQKEAEKTRQVYERIRANLDKMN